MLNTLSNTQNTFSITVFIIIVRIVSSIARGNGLVGPEWEVGEAEAEVVSGDRILL